MQIRTIYVLSTKDKTTQSLIEDKEGIELFTSGLFDTEIIKKATVKAYSCRVSDIVIKKIIYVDSITILEE